MNKFRETIIAILKNNKGELLIGLNPRINSIKGGVLDKDTYKFPQCGILENERKTKALKRELLEELNLDVSKFANIKNINEYVSYWFVNKNKSDFEIRLFPFLIEVENLKIENLKIDKTEFSKIKWVKPEKIEYLNLGIRHQSYLTILRKFDLI